MEGIWIYDREQTAIPAAGELRLLPWTTGSGKPCYLSGTPDSLLSCYADELEEAQLEEGHRALKRILPLLARQTGADDETARATRKAALALSNVIRVADSRGARLPEADQ
ncbi:sulfatase [Streptomyces sp. 3N207]|uniref:sulfatase n=1 Tax=Streptomyces sp. 3N207 TaxID=3457417 RepID=UPI003FD09400